MLGVSMASLRLPTLDERIGWAREQGFDAAELLATGEPWGVHAPSVSREDRDFLRVCLEGFAGVSVQAPHQATFDVTLVSPSASIRRASVTEIWSVCRFVEAVGGGAVLVRCGMPPGGVSEDRMRAYLSECLTTLDRMAGDHNAVIAILNRDYFASLENFRGLDSLALKHTGIALDLENIAGAGLLTERFVRDYAGRIAQVRVPVARAAALPAVGVDSGESGLAAERMAALLKGTDFRGIVCFASEGTGAEGVEGAAATLLTARERWRQRWTSP